MADTPSNHPVEAPGAQTLPRRSFLIIRNNHAGLKSTRLVAGVAEALGQRGVIVHVVETQSADDAAHAIKEVANVDAVVAAGGDGTVRALALTLDEMGLRLPIGLIPAGTGNVLANEVRLPRHATRLAELLVRGASREVAIMQANGAPFLLMASSGFDAEVLLRLSVRLKQRMARAAYTLPTLSVLARAPPTPFDIVIDGVRHTATWAIITNSRTYGASFTLTYSNYDAIPVSPVTITDSNANSITVAVTISDTVDGNSKHNGTATGTFPALTSSGSVAGLRFGTVTMELSS